MGCFFAFPFQDGCYWFKVEPLLDTLPSQKTFLKQRHGEFVTLDILFPFFWKFQFWVLCFSMGDCFL